jgi:hypothetical protein
MVDEKNRARSMQETLSFKFATNKKNGLLKGAII